MAKRSELYELALTKVGGGYAWGSNGGTLTEDAYKKLKATYGASHYVFSWGTVWGKWKNEWCSDCSGLVGWCLRQLGVVDKDFDTTAAGFYKKYCDPVKASEVVKGDLGFVPDGDGYNHVVICDGNGGCVEARGSYYGIQNNKLSKRSAITVFGRLKCLEDDEATATEDIPETVQLGDRGDTVKKLQKLLDKLGFKCDVDGIFGKETKAAVVLFQKRYCKVQNWGKVGSKTWKALIKATA